MVVRDRDGEPVDPRDVLDDRELAVLAAQRGLFGAEWALRGRCGHGGCPNLIPVTDTHCLTHLPPIDFHQEE